NDQKDDQALRDRHSRMVAVLRDLVLVCPVVSARPISPRPRLKPDLDGKCRALRNRRLVLVQALAIASWIQAELLFAATGVCSGIRNGLDCLPLRARIAAWRTNPGDDGFVACRLPAASRRSVVLHR